MACTCLPQVIKVTVVAVLVGGQRHYHEQHIRELHISRVIQADQVEQPETVATHHCHIIRFLATGTLDY